MQTISISPFVFLAPGSTSIVHLRLCKAKKESDEEVDLVHLLGSFTEDDGSWEV